MRSLQELRHKADDDLAATFDRAAVLNSLAQQDKAFADWHSVRTDPVAPLYLGLLGRPGSDRR